MGLNGLASEVVSLFRRGITRASEMAVVGWILEQLGLLSGFSAALAEGNHAFGAGLIAMVASVLFDLWQLATRPDLTIKSCDDPQERLPLE
ncbi:hypothetical protein [Aurantiacibacter spongiae]|uniref:Uncharacterized protein n=1 Tax=Aurantiacibacter spongiae TaxID=2488860 RepID=A0A3N5CUY5_9SPHN|nr:hypothetical protein [Aurantiacibacter spongiae]RPF70429.1 hypothetical protein EG799_01395 [Aurantiacibacter spongiae]